jgi:hypothetical protein
VVTLTVLNEAQSDVLANIVRDNHGLLLRIKVRFGSIAEIGASVAYVRLMV